MVMLPLSRGWAQAPTPDETMEDLVQTIRLEQKIQTQGSAWEREQAALTDEIRRHELERAWYDSQVNTFTKYVDKAREKVGELERRKREMERIQDELEGRLIEWAQGLSTFVKADLPFQVQERDHRLAFLENSVNDYALEPGEKLRRLLEGFQAELGYGHQVVATRETRTIQGQSRDIFCLRTGRLGLYALGRDRQQAWAWAGEFIPLDSQGLENLILAWDMVDAKTYTQLAPLPIGEVIHEP